MNKYPNLHLTFPCYCAKLEIPDSPDLKQDSGILNPPLDLRVVHICLPFNDCHNFVKMNLPCAPFKCKKH